MGKIDDALEILVALGMPRGQQNERSALVLLALAGVRPSGSWRNAGQAMLRIWDIMGFMREAYQKDYAANTRETIRRQTIHQFEQARIVDRNPDEPLRPTNSGKTVYRLTDEALLVLKSYGSNRFRRLVRQFCENFGTLDLAYQRRRAGVQIPIVLPDGVRLSLSPGAHNQLQVAIIQQWAPRFAPESKLLSLGDTAKKRVVCDLDELASLGVPITEHGKLPDVVLFDPKKSWLFLIEAVTSHGPVSPKRHREFEAMVANCRARRIYVSAFLIRDEFRKHASDIAWDTEVWIAESPDHMIHFNGPKCLGSCPSGGAIEKA